MNEIRAWVRRTFWQHQWVKGRNPYRRTCSVCGRHEVSYCRSMESWNNAWWEAHDDGTPAKHWA